MNYDPRQSLPRKHSGFYCFFYWNLKLDHARSWPCAAPYRYVYRHNWLQSERMRVGSERIIIRIIRSENYLGVAGRKRYHLHIRLTYKMKLMKLLFHIAGALFHLGVILANRAEKSGGERGREGKGCSTVY